MLECAAYNADYYNRAVYYLSYALDAAIKDTILLEEEIEPYINKLN